MDSTSPEVVTQIERVLEQKLSATVTQDYTNAGGIESIVQILNGVDRGTERTILDSLEIQDPELAEEIKKRMFVFEDIVNVDNRSIQRIIKDIDNADLQLALKVASEEVRDVIFRNMSKRMAETFREEMEYMGPVRLRDVEEAQTRIVGTIRRLEESGEIIIARGGGDDIIARQYAGLAEEPDSEETPGEVHYQDPAGEAAEQARKQMLKDAQEFAEGQVRNASQEAENIMESARTEAEEWWRQRREQDEHLVEAVKSEGFQQGYMEGIAHAEQEMSQRLAEMMEEARNVLQEAYRA
ncbi:hypothetical protein KC345_g11877, partial [Hortaea werneckii]